MVVNKKVPEPKSVAVDAKTGKQSGSSTYRVDAASSMTIKGSNGSVTVMRSTKPVFDARPSSYANMASPAPQPLPVQQQPQQIQPQAQTSQMIPQFSQPPQDQSSLSLSQGNQSPQNNPVPSSISAPGTQNQPMQPSPIQGGEAYGVNPNESFISQTGEYQHPFFSAEGQGERLQNALATVNPFRMNPTLIGGKDISGLSEATTAFIWAANAAAALNAAATVWNAYRGATAIGATAAAPGGAQAIANTMPFELPKFASAAKAVAPAANTANAANTINAVKSILPNAKLLTLGGTLTLMGIGINGQSQLEKDATAYIEDSGDLAIELRDLGMTDFADEIAGNQRDLEEALDSIITYVPYFGKNMITGDLEGYKRRLAEINRSYKARVKQDLEKEKQRAIEEDKQALEEQRRYNEGREEEQRRYDESRLEEQRRYNEGQKSETPQPVNYNPFNPVSTPADAGGSNLKFGLLK